MCRLRSGPCFDGCPCRGWHRGRPFAGRTRRGFADAAHRLDHGADFGDRQRAQRAYRPPRRGRHHHRRRQQQLSPFGGSSPAGACGARHPFRRCRHQRRRVRAGARLLPDDRRREERVRPSRTPVRNPGAGRRGRRADAGRERRAVAGRTGISPLRAGRRRAFRQDGPQRHRIRHDGVDRRGHEPSRPCRQGSDGLRAPIIASISTSRRLPKLWRRGSVISSWLVDLTAAALAESPALDGFSGHVADSGEGRWTAAGRDRTRRSGAYAVGRAVRSLQLPRQWRFRQRILSAMRKQFGGHREAKGGGG